MHDYECGGFISTLFLRLFTCPVCSLFPFPLFLPFLEYFLAFHLFHLSVDQLPFWRVFSDRTVLWLWLSLSPLVQMQQTWDLGPCSVSCPHGSLQLLLHVGKRCRTGRVSACAVVEGIPFLLVSTWWLAQAWGESKRKPPLCPSQVPSIFCLSESIKPSAAFLLSDVRFPEL